MFIYPIYNNWMNISTVYIYNKTSIKRNILTIKQNTWGSRSGQGLTSTPVIRHLLLVTASSPIFNSYIFFFKSPTYIQKKIIKLSFFIPTLLCHTTMYNRLHHYLLQFEIRTVGYFTRISYNSSTSTYKWLPLLQISLYNRSNNCIVIRCSAASHSATLLITEVLMTRNTSFDNCSVAGHLYLRGIGLSGPSGKFVGWMSNCLINEE
jgi:hypothetical protein